MKTLYNICGKKKYKTAHNNQSDHLFHFIAHVKNIKPELLIFDVGNNGHSVIYEAYMSLSQAAFNST